MQRYFGRILDRQVILEEDDIFHLTRVMRCKVGDNIEVVSDGLLYLAEITSFRPLQITLVRKLRENNELPNHVILIASLLKGEKMDFVLQKATELGVSEIFLLQSERSVVKFKREEKDVKFQRFNKILKEAAEQSKRTKIPTLYRLRDISHLKDIDADIKLIAYEEMEGPTTGFLKIVENIKPKQKIAIVIGPEGGFSNKEVYAATECGYRKVSLGRRILRAETASLYALSVIANQLEKK